MDFTPSAMHRADYFRDYINDTLTAAADIIYTEFQQTFDKYQQQIDTQRRLIDIRLEKQRHFLTTDNPEQIWAETLRWKKDQSPFPEPVQLEDDLEEPVPSQNEDQVQLLLKQEEESIMVTAINDDYEHRGILLHGSHAREFIYERLTAVAGTIFSGFHETITQYQEEVDDQRRLLDIVLKPQIKLHRIDVPQQNIYKEEQELWNQEMTSTLDEEERESPQIKEEQEELFVNQEGEKLGLKRVGCMIIPTAEPGTSEQGELSIPQESFAPERQHTKKRQQIESSSQRAKPKSTSESPSSVHEIGQLGGNLYSCVTCGKHFKLRSNLSIHLRIHTGEKPYSCETCNKSFSQRGSLVIHMRIHTGEKPYSCVTCGKDFRRQSHLSSHMLTHTGEKPYVCRICGKNFSRRGSVLVHKRIHTGEKPYSCATCQKKFNQRSSLLSHTRTHTGEKPYSCVTCGKNYSRAATLLEHTRTHTVEKPYSCEICEKDFVARSTFSAHMKTHSDGKLKSFKERQQL